MEGAATRAPAKGLSCPCLCPYSALRHHPAVSWGARRGCGVGRESRPHGSLGAAGHHRHFFWDPKFRGLRCFGWTKFRTLPCWRERGAQRARGTQRGAERRRDPAGLQNNTRLLVLKGVLGCRDSNQQGVAPRMLLTVAHELRRGFGHLRGTGERGGAEGRRSHVRSSEIACSQPMRGTPERPRWTDRHTRWVRSVVTLEYHSARKGARL